MERIERVESRRGTPPVRLELLSAAEREYERAERERRRRRRDRGTQDSSGADAPGDERPRLDLRA